MEATAKSESGSSIRAVESNGTQAANYSESLREIKVCNAKDRDCTARKGYVCSHAGPCKLIVGNNTDQPRCPDCGSIALKFSSRDNCEGDYYWCHACGCGPIKFPLNMRLSIDARIAAKHAIEQLAPVLNGNKAVCLGTCMCQPENHGGKGACGKRMEIPAVMSADDLQDELAKTPF